MKGWYYSNDGKEKFALISDKELAKKFFNEKINGNTTIWTKEVKE